MDLASHPTAAETRIERNSGITSVFANIPDPDPAWAERNPDRALAFLYVSPRPCDALDRLLGL